MPESDLSTGDAVDDGALRRLQACRSAPVARAIALLIGSFTLLNLLAWFRTPGFDANLWWIDLRGFPASARQALLGIAGPLLFGFAVRPSMSRARHAATVAVTLLLFAASAANVAQFYALLAGSSITSAFPIPFSLLVAAAIGVVLYRVLFAATRVPDLRKFLTQFALTVGACTIAFPLAQIFCFGKTNYRRPADAVVVLGARAYADGRPSDALADRVRTACMLYHDGLVPKLIFSGGPGDGTVHETESMRRFALSLGVRNEDILLDPGGLNTKATVDNTRAIASRLNAGRVLVVSHSYHLPRVKLACQQAGLDVYTVPARERYTLTKMPYLVAREVVALWAYYASAALGW